MKFLAAFLLGASVAYAQIQCAPDTYGCRHNDVSPGQMDSVTRGICEDLELGSCFCPQFHHTFCDVVEDDIEVFRQLCEARGNGWHVQQCQ